MMNKKMKNCILIMAVLVVVLAIALLLSFTLAKYKSELQGYTEFGAERFNVAINLYEEQVEQKTIVYTLSAKDFQPGMKTLALGNAEGSTEQDTSAVTKFYVANGTSADNATSMAIRYTIRIRTSHSLPLKYTLKTEDGSYYETLPEATLIQAEHTENRYEYLFNPRPIAGASTVAEGDTANVEEATFLLEAGTNEQPLNQKLHELIVEWPSDVALATSKYMKEVEMIEIVVTATSQNKLDDEDYIPSPNPSSSPRPPEYADGIVLLIPQQNEEGVNLPSGSYIYPIDLRSFHKVTGQDEADTSGIFNVTLNNAVGIGAVQQDTRYISYSMKLKVPLQLVESSYVFTAYPNDLGEAVVVENILNATPKYRVYDEKLHVVVDSEGLPIDLGVEGAVITEYTAVSEIPEELKEDPYRIYAVYDFMFAEDQNVLVNERTDTGGTVVPNNDTNGFRLKIHTLEGLENTANNELVFRNKLELLVEAQFTNQLGNEGGDSHE